MILGRDLECARLDSLLVGVRAGHGGSLALRGEPGVGKTALMNYVLQRCADLHRLRLLGVQAEGAVPYAGLHQLMSPLRPTFDRLPQRQARALRAALGSQAVTEFDPTAFYSGLLSLSHSG